MNKKILAGTVAVLVVTGGYIFFVMFSQDTKVSTVGVANNNPIVTEPLNLEDIKYIKQPLPIEHRFNKNEMSPLVGSALVDINNDGLDEVFIGGGTTQNDTWYQYQDNVLIDITSRVQWNNSTQRATYGAAAVDYDNDADADVFVARIDGVFYYENINGRTFAEEKKIDIALEDGAVPTGITLGDVNKDGSMDMFVSTYLRHDLIEGSTIFNREDHGTISKLLLGKGNLLFEDSTEKSGLTYRHNTFAGSFVDTDTDADLDLVVAYDTGAVRIYQNDGAANFTIVSDTPWENKYGYPMGIGVGNINNDQYPDFFFSNAGQSLPEFALRGDLRKDQTLFTEWSLYQNQGKNMFTEQNKSLDLAKHEFAWGGVLTDINLDGREDLIVSENYVKIPQQRIKPLPGRVFFQNEEGKFIPQEKRLALENPQFSLSSLVTDWNQDGIQDILWVNIEGFSQLYISQVATPKKAKQIQVPYDVRFLGSTWKVTFADGKNLYWSYTPAEGLGSHQTRTWFLPEVNQAIQKIEVTFSDGTKEDGTQYQNVR